MTWLAVLLIGVGVTDLVHSVRPVRRIPEVVGGTVVLVTCLLAGLDEGRDLVALVVLVALTLAWGQAVTWGFGPRGRPWVPLALLGAALAAAVLASPAAGAADGVLRGWLDAGPLPVLDGLDPDRLLLLLGGFLVQLSTGNVVVRLVLGATGTVNPHDHGGASDPGTQLKGGRLLGPMERVFILGLGLAGQLTAASIVIAAKGLLRFPELSSKSEQFRIHQLTEYFLVGSFMSWLVALSTLVLLA